MSKLTQVVAEFTSMQLYNQGFIFLLAVGQRPFPASVAGPVSHDLTLSIGSSQALVSSKLAEDDSLRCGFTNIGYSGTVIFCEERICFFFKSTIASFSDYKKVHNHFKTLYTKSELYTKVKRWCLGLPLWLSW